MSLIKCIKITTQLAEINEYCSFLSIIVGISPPVRGAKAAFCPFLGAKAGGMLCGAGLLWKRKPAVLRPAGVVLLSGLSSVMSLLCVLLDSAEEDGYLHRFVCFLTITRSQADCGRRPRCLPRPKRRLMLLNVYRGCFLEGDSIRKRFD